ncbi:VOC family protein [Pseudomonadales bacterium]|nr:VOC family protein [Pseudomonadales bacterium]MDA9366258.1 VOC family protein [Pseudomonadales bacterium]MDB4150263.1 VOC family protein [Pseudomonadales bacterium]MDB9866893.1 VOC family protein [Pseudomonadales bacterium]MDC0174019.1 VOC family protein [Pseudomonadales bacterium]|tara:strand:- start:796 stop:1479 length:684 start_codon:yes stop_codon:yes gene_type:complete
MNKVEGLHHLAISTGDMKAQIEFFTEKIGMQLQALYWMHGVENTKHCFLRLNDESSIAFVHNPDIEQIASHIGQSHAGNAGANSAPGTMQHLAFKVQDDEALYHMRDRLRSQGIPVLGPIEHGLCRSIYFAGLENMTLEFAYSKEPIDNNVWIDPEVVELLDISAAELARYKQPADYSDQGGQVSQPAADTPGPHMTNYPPGAYARVISIPDDVVLNMVDSTPPVKV